MKNPKPCAICHVPRRRLLTDLPSLRRVCRSCARHTLVLAYCPPRAVCHPRSGAHPYLTPIPDPARPGLSPGAPPETPPIRGVELWTVLAGRQP